MMGVTPDAAVRALVDAGADAVGANCGRGPDEMEPIATQMRDAREAIGAEVLLVAQSNAGLPQLEGSEFVYTVGPEEMAAHAMALRDLGIDVIGACCGSSPDHIRAMARALGGDGTD